MSRDVSNDHTYATTTDIILGTFVENPQATSEPFVGIIHSFKIYLDATTLLPLVSDIETAVFAGSESVLDPSPTLCSYLLGIWDNMLFFFTDDHFTSPLSPGLEL